MDIQQVIQEITDGVAELDLSWNNLTDDGLKYLAQALPNSNVEVLLLWGIYIPPHRFFSLWDSRLFFSSILT